MLLVDAAATELVLLDPGPGDPQVAGRVPLPGPAVHLAIDPDHRTVVVSSTTPEEGALTVVDLERLEVVGTIPVTTSEPGVLVGDGLVVHRDGAEDGTAELFRIDGGGTPVDTAPVGAWGHGEAYLDDHVYIATEDGLEVLHLDGSSLEAETVVPWGVGDRDWGRAYYLRVVGADEPRVWTYVRDQSGDAWGTWRNDLYVVTPGADEAQRQPLGDGLAFRFAVAEDVALVARMHPDGYAAHLIDTDPESPTFLEVLEEIPLTTPTGAPAATADMTAVWESPGRPIAAITPDGEVGYVSRGGDGLIDVLDLVDGTVDRTLEVPSPLDGGGYLLVTPGPTLVDRNAR